MTTKSKRGAWLTALTLMAVIATSGAQALDVRDPPRVRPCEDVSDPGFGGAKVSCQRPCDKGSFLQINVYSHDSPKGGYASVGGTFECGGESASCQATKECTGVSKGLTKTQDGTGTCAGYSDEFWNSKLSVDCTADVPAPDVPVFCPVLQPIPVCVNPDPTGGTLTTAGIAACNLVAQNMPDPLELGVPLIVETCIESEGQQRTSMHWEPAAGEAFGLTCVNFQCQTIPVNVDPQNGRISS